MEESDLWRKSVHAHATRTVPVQQREYTAASHFILSSQYGEIMTAWVCALELILTARFG